MIKLQELKPKFKAPRHENLRELLRYAAKEYGSDTAFIVKHKTARKCPMNTFPSKHSGTA